MKKIVHKHVILIDIQQLAQACGLTTTGAQS